MTLKNFLFPVLLLLCLQMSAQSDTIALKEVVVSDTQLRDYSNTQQVMKLSDSVIARNTASLTSLLQYNSVIYFKENGLGMVSSPSFRGTTASQTAVVWNGININSQLNGQTDFSTLNTRDFSSISVRAGGGSVLYGSSAIGGTVHLNNDLIFGKEFTNTVRADYGSFNTLGLNYNIKAGSERFTTDVRLSRNSSDNDYEYPGYNLKNENGQYYNYSFNAGAAFKVNNKNILRFYSYAFNGEKHFSRTLAAPSRSKYHDLVTRNLLEWTGYYGKFTSRAKVAYLYEKYKYFENFETNIFTYGRVNTFIGRYDAAYAFSDAIKLNAVADYTQNKGEGSDIINQKREIGSGSLLFRHKVMDNLQYELGIRKEFTVAYESPVLFSAGANINVATFYTLKLNGSRNFRMPTFNDLYWQGSGNPNLKPETSWQAEIGNTFKFSDITFNVTGYYIKLMDMLRWVPSQDGIWRPENLDKATSYGFESTLNWSRKTYIGTFEATGTYACTVSRRDSNSEQLIYVPLHKATAALAYTIQNFSAYYRHLFTGEVFYTTDNLSSLDPHNVSSIGIEYSFKVLKGLDVGLQCNNLWNEEYQAVNVRPMPGRNYNMYLNFKF